MIMGRSDDQLLLPVSPWFIWLSLLVALVLNLIPLGRLGAMPDFLALVLVFWNLHQPRRVGVGVAFVFGLAMDVNAAALLGQHALAYSLLSYFAATVHRRLSRFSPAAQAVQILPLWYAAQAVSVLVQMVAGHAFPGWQILLAPIFASLLWPLACALLLAPQRRAPNPDMNRPL